MTFTNITLPYGNRELIASVPEANLIGVFEPRNDLRQEEETDLLRRALQQPIGSDRLASMCRGSSCVAVVISDLTRPCPSGKMLPPLLEELAAGGVTDDQIIVIIALGLHRRMSDEELEAAIGPKLFRRLVVINHDPEDVVNLGSTSKGTPVEIFRPLVEANLRICLGNLEFHYFAGFSGGAKAVLPGCASQKTITANHAFMVHEAAHAGQLNENPVRQDIEEGASMIGVDFIFNVVLDVEHRIAAAVAGNVRKAHRLGCELVAERGSVPVPRTADIVIVSAGGDPTDLNLYQAQKALDNAVHAVKPGGVIIWVAACGEGFGNAVFQEWLEVAKGPDQILERIQQSFVLGGHKAAAIANALKRARIFLVSDLELQSALSGLSHYEDVEQALAAARQKLGEEATYTVLPHGASVFPLVCT